MGVEMRRILFILILSVVMITGIFAAKPQNSMLYSNLGFISQVNIYPVAANFSVGFTSYTAGNLLKSVDSVADASDTQRGRTIPARYFPEGYVEKMKEKERADRTLKNKDIAHSVGYHLQLDMAFIDKFIMGTLRIGAAFRQMINPNLYAYEYTGLSIGVGSSYYYNPYDTTSNSLYYSPVISSIMTYCDAGLIYLIPNSSVYVGGGLSFEIGFGTNSRFSMNSGPYIATIFDIGLNAYALAGIAF